MKLIKSKGRKKLYSGKGILRMECCFKGCNNQAEYQWCICSNDGKWMPICVDCDILVNSMYLKLVEGINFKSMIKKYKRKVKGEL